MGNSESQREKSIDHIKRPGREQRIIDAARRVFKGQEESWLSTGYVYYQLYRRHRRYGLETEYDVGLPNQFENVIRHCGHFDVERDGKELLMRPKKESWPPPSESQVPK